MIFQISIVLAIPKEPQAFDKRQGGENDLQSSGEFREREYVKPHTPQSKNTQGTMCCIFNSCS